VAVVEDDLELAALVRLDDLALHLDLLFLVGYVSTSFRMCGSVIVPAMSEPEHMIAGEHYLSGVEEL
jgi:hypothetical protein